MNYTKRFGPLKPPSAFWIHPANSQYPPQCTSVRSLMVSFTDILGSRRLLEVPSFLWSPKPETEPGGGVDLAPPRVPGSCWRRALAVAVQELNLSCTPQTKVCTMYSPYIPIIMYHISLLWYLNLSIHNPQTILLPYIPIMVT